MKTGKLLKRLGALTLAAGMVLALPASAATPRKTNGYKWPYTPITVGIRCEIDESYQVQMAMATWNAVKNFNGNNMVTLQINYYASRAIRKTSELPPWTVAAMTKDTTGNQFTAVGIDMNSAKSWGMNGASNVYDIQTVVLHELGHCLGVAHCHETGEDCFSATCNQNAMTPWYGPGTIKRYLNNYDTSSYKVIYG